MNIRCYKKNSYILIHDKIHNWLPNCSDLDWRLVTREMDWIPIRKKYSYHRIFQTFVPPYEFLARNCRVEVPIIMYGLLNKPVNQVS